MIGSNYNYKPKSVFLISLNSIVSSFLFGYEIGITALISDHWQNEPIVVIATIVSSVSFGAVCILYIICKYSDLIGRKQEIILAGGFYALASLISIYSNQNFQRFIFARILYGFGVGLTTHSAPLLISEHIPASIRGTIITFKESGIVFGIVIGNILGNYYNSNSSSPLNVFRLSFYLGLSLIGHSLFIPETPRYLALKQREEEMEAAIAFVYEDSPETIKNVKNNISISVEQTHEDSLLENHSYQIALGLITLQQITGQPATLYYLNDFIQSPKRVVALNIIKLCSTILTSFFIETRGRRNLLKWGIYCMIVSTKLLTLIFLFIPNSQWVYFLMIPFTAGYQIAFGTVTWTIISEIFPQNIRGKAVAIAVTANFFWNYIVIVLIPVIKTIFGKSSLFFIYTGFLWYSLYFVDKAILETKGKSLEEIKFGLQRRAHANKDTCNQEGDKFRFWKSTNLIRSTYVGSEETKMDLETEMKSLINDSNIDDLELENDHNSENL